MAITAKSSVLTGDGWMYAKDVLPGDWVYNRLGQPVKVKTTQTFRAEECYRVTFDDFFVSEGDGNLAFPSEDYQYRKRSFSYLGKRPRTAQPKIRSVNELLERGIYYKGTRKFFSVPTTEPIQLPTQPLGIPPFVYGFWFMSRKKEKILSAPLEFADMIYEEFQNAGYKVEKLGPHLKDYEKFRTEPSIWKQLVGEDTYKIPLNYLNGSAEQRLALLQGMIATRPTRSTKRSFSVSMHLRKKQTITAIQWLAESLGAKTRITYDKSVNLHRLNMIRLVPFIGETKRVAHLARRYVKSIEKIPAQLCTHIETDEENSSFLVGEGFIPCH